MNVEDMQAKSVLFSVYSMTEKTKFLVHVSPGSTETLARGGGTTNQQMLLSEYAIKCNSVLTQQHLCK